jgi:hypothetical protein
MQAIGKICGTYCSGGQERLLVSIYRGTSADRHTRRPAPKAVDETTGSEERVHLVPVVALHGQSGIRAVA